MNSNVQKSYHTFERVNSHEQGPNKTLKLKKRTLKVNLQIIGQILKVTYLKWSKNRRRCFKNAVDAVGHVETMRPVKIFVSKLKKLKKLFILLKTFA